MKGIDFDKYYYPVLSAPTIFLIVAISATYQLTIGIADVTNDFQNTLKASCKHDIIEFPPHCISWLKFRFPAIQIEPATDGHYIMEICHGIQGSKSTRLQWNTISCLLLSALGFAKHVIYQNI